MKRAVDEDNKRELEIVHVSGSSYLKQTFTDNPYSNDVFGLTAGIGLSGKIKQHREYFFDFKYQRSIGGNDYKYMNYFTISAAIHIGK